MIFTVQYTPKMKSPILIIEALHRSLVEPLKEPLTWPFIYTGTLFLRPPFTLKPYSSPLLIIKAPTLCVCYGFLKFRL